MAKKQKRVYADDMAEGDRVTFTVTGTLEWDGDGWIVQEDGPQGSSWMITLPDHTFKIRRTA
jgi:hypothetical protein